MCLYQYFQINVKMPPLHIHNTIHELNTPLLDVKLTSPSNEKVIGQFSHP